MYSNYFLMSKDQSDTALSTIDKSNLHSCSEHNTESNIVNRTARIDRRVLTEIFLSLSLSLSLTIHHTLKHTRSNHGIHNTSQLEYRLLT